MVTTDHVWKYTVTNTLYSNVPYCILLMMSNSNNSKNTLLLPIFLCEDIQHQLCDISEALQSFYTIRYYLFIYLCGFSYNYRNLSQLFKEVWTR